MKENYFYLLKYGLAILFFFCTITTFAQQNVFSGKVIDENDQPLPGATIRVRGSNTAIATDTKGAFTFRNAQNAVHITVNFVGYDALEQDIDAGRTATIQMHPNAASLSEVVVIGYGTQKKSDVTGSITTVSSKDFNPGPVTNPLQQIEGQAAGVTVTQTGSQPGSTTCRRGLRSGMSARNHRP